METRDREIQDILNSLPTQSLNAINRLRQMGRPGVPALAVALKYPDPTIRAGAARALARMNDPDGVPALAEAVADPDSSVRLAAILGLAEFPGAEAVQALAQALRARHALVRDCAARALACRSLSALRAALDDPDPVVRAAAAHGIGYYARDRRSASRLREMLDDEDGDVRIMAVRALAWISRCHPSVLPNLLIALEHPDENVRATGAYYAGRVGNRDACEALVRLLGDSSREVVLGAIRSLGSPDAEAHGTYRGVGDARAIPGLLAHLAGPDADLRVAAAGALGCVLHADPYGERPPEMLTRLVERLEDSDARVRSAAATALGESSDGRAVEPLVRALQDPVWSVRAAAASALGALGDARAIPALESATDDIDLAVARRAEAALHQLRVQLA